MDDELLRLKQSDLRQYAASVGFLIDRRESRRSQIFLEGSYNFEIVHGCDKESRVGNSMIELTVKMTDANGASRIVEYLLEQRPVKLRHAAEACGMCFPETPAKSVP